MIAVKIKAISAQSKNTSSFATLYLNHKVTKIHHSKMYRDISKKVKI